MVYLWYYWRRFWFRLKIQTRLKPTACLQIAGFSVTVTYLRLDWHGLSQIIFTFNYSTNNQNVFLFCIYTDIHLTVAFHMLGWINFGHYSSSIIIIQKAFYCQRQAYNTITHCTTNVTTFLISKNNAFCGNSVLRIFSRAKTIFLY